MDYLNKDLEAMAGIKNLYLWILSEIQEYVNGTVAEIGAGRGTFTSWLLDLPIDKLYSFEPSSNMFPLLQEKFLKNKWVSPENAFLEDRVNQYLNTFDSMVYINVLEHIRDDKAQLDCVYKCLKQEGKLVIFVPALSGLLSKYDKKIGHYRRYHKSQLANLVRSANFEILKVNYMDMPGIIPWYLSMVLLKKDLGYKKALLYDRLVIPIVQKVEKVIPPPFGKNLMLIARKN